MAGDLLEALRNAPLCAISKRWPHKVHAVDAPEVARATSHHRSMRAVCGTGRLRLLVHDGEAMSWPPAPVASALRRCRGCWEATGRPAPHPRRSLFARRP
jgi:hypothetical protein